MKIRKSTTMTLAFAWLFIPVLLFFGGWLRPLAGVPLCAIALACFWLARKANRRAPGADACLELPAWVWIVAVAALAAWCFVSGLGGWYYQSNDHHWRNATFRDLIDFDWPVYYPLRRATLIYYVGHWLPAALAGKALGWQAANAVLYAWSLAGLVIAFALVCHRARADSGAKAAAVLLVFVFFSGLDVVGVLHKIVMVGTIPVMQHELAEIHIEWWARPLQYSSNMTQLMWVYNQSVAAWIVTALMANELEVANVCLATFLSFLFAPFCFVGLAPIGCALIGKRLAELAHQRRLGTFAKEAFSIQNVLAVTTMFPVCLAYFKCNGQSDVYGIRVASYLHDPGFWTDIYVPFVLLEFLCYSALLAKRRMRDPVFVTLNVSLLVIPFFMMDEFGDFQMRASIPALFLLMIYVVERLIEETRREARPTFVYCALVALLALGAVTPLVEQCRALTNIRAAGRLALVADDIRTFSNKQGEHVDKLMCFSPSETFFFKHLARFPHAVQAGPGVAGSPASATPAPGANAGSLALN